MHYNGHHIYLSPRDLPHMRRQKLYVRGAGQYAHFFTTHPMHDGAVVCCICVRLPGVPDGTWRLIERASGDMGYYILSPYHGQGAFATNVNEVLAAVRAGQPMPPSVVFDPRIIAAMPQPVQFVAVPGRGGVAVHTVRVGNEHYIYLGMSLRGDKALDAPVFLDTTVDRPPFALREQYVAKAQR